LKNGAIILPLSLFVQTFSNPLGSYLQQRIHPAIILTIGSTIMLSAVLLASYVKTWEMYVLCMAVIFPLGIG
jgi:hypothetical protein